MGIAQNIKGKDLEFLFNFGHACYYDAVTQSKNFKKPVDILERIRGSTVKPIPHQSAVLKMLAEIGDVDHIGAYIKRVKEKDNHAMLYGFGHRVYKNYDPRAKIIKQAADRVLNKLKIHDPMLDIARSLEEAALSDPYFKEKKLYPNVDFYSGIIMRAIGIPLDMFTVMFAIGRMPGWIANWKEVWEGQSRIYRPRQIYTGPPMRDYVPTAQRRPMVIAGMSGEVAASGACR
jgi:hypothetical protein